MWQVKELVHLLALDDRDYLLLCGRQGHTWTFLFTRRPRHLCRTGQTFWLERLTHPSLFQSLGLGLGLVGLFFSPSPDNRYHRDDRDRPPPRKRIHFK